MAPYLFDILVILRITESVNPAVLVDNGRISMYLIILNRLYRAGRFYRASGRGTFLRYPMPVTSVIWHPAAAAKRSVIFNISLISISVFVISACKGIKKY